VHERKRGPVAGLDVVPADVGREPKSMRDFDVPDGLDVTVLQIRVEILTHGQSRRF